ncbi:protein regulator of cytokinesis 1-like [Ptychodera flava]|uniref:protein regulator of cytokinesis 1-like n=1 Tax=Ptychodera flava TaxID=63121 RepID=UPI00396A2336
MTMENQKEVMKNEVGAHLVQALERLHSIWDEIGIGESQRADRQEVVMHHLRALLDEMVSEEEGLRQKLLKSVESCGQELLKLCLELSLAPYEPEENLTVLQLEKDLRTQVDKLSKVKHDRLQKLKKLKETEQHLCDVLCTTPYYVPTGSVPSEEQLETLQEHIDSLKSEKEKRSNIFTKTKQNIIVILEDLEQCPNTSFERDIVCEEEDSFLLSSENMAALKTLYTELQGKQKEVADIADSLRESITTLWDRLMVDSSEREKFLAEHSGYKPKVIEALQKEVARLEELKKQNIQRVTEGIREELKTWWDKCFYSRQQRHAFTAAYDDNFTEELLELHDQEIQKVKNYYKENKEMLDLVKKREDMWKKMLEFEKKANDPNRFANRGGNLLQEEKTRKRLQKELPKVEMDLGERIKQWEQEKGTEFLFDGCRFMDYVQAQWTAHEQEKKLHKELRLKARAMETEQEMRWGSKPTTPVKRRFIGTTTPTKTPKRMRGLNGSAAPSPAHRIGVTHSSICPSPSRNGRPPKSAKKPLPSAAKPSKTPVRRSTRRALADHNTRDTTSSAFSTTTLSGATSTGSNASTNISIASTCGSYDDFTHGLNAGGRSNYRSSALPSPTLGTHSRVTGL